MAQAPSPMRQLSASPVIAACQYTKNSTESQLILVANPEYGRLPQSVLSKRGISIVYGLVALSLFICIFICIFITSSMGLMAAQRVFLMAHTFCSHHHRLVHEGGYTIQRVDNNDHRLKEQFSQWFVVLYKAVIILSAIPA